jgi:hypothetical protein
MNIQTLITKYEKLSKALEGFETKELIDNFLADLQKLKSKNGTHVNKSVCERCGGSGELAGGLVECPYCDNY